MLSKNKTKLEIKLLYLEKLFIFSKTFLLSKKVSVNIKSKHKNIPIHKAKIIGKIKLKLHIENKSKNILQPNVQGASPETNHIKIDDFISFLQTSFSFFLIEI